MDDPDRRSVRRCRTGRTQLVAGLMLVSLTPGCATAPLTQGISLSSYAGLRPSEGALTKSLLRAERAALDSAKTVRILPAIFVAPAAPALSNQQRTLVANVVSRALCVSLSDRFEVVAPVSAADLTVHASVTQATETDELAAGVSRAVSFVPTIIDFGVPVPIPRIPFGLGSLSLEAEAVDRSGKQIAAMLWARGADAITSSPKVSKASDAYDLAAEFAADFSHLIATGESPFGGLNVPNLPSLQKVQSALGGAPKYAACESYGRSPGLVGAVAGKIGLPPEWTDNGPANGGKP